MKKQAYPVSVANVGEKQEWCTQVQEVQDGLDDLLTYVTRKYPNAAKPNQFIICSGLVQISRQQHVSRRSIVVGVTGFKLTISMCSLIC